MKLSKDGHMLDPDYSKSTLEVYRDSVEAALVNFEKADVLLYITGEEEPSWIPRWNIPMLFRNPFRFGKPMPWKPAGDTKSAWSIDKDTNVLSLSGFSLDVITHAESYNQLNFANTIIDSVEGKTKLRVYGRAISTPSQLVLTALYRLPDPSSRLPQYHCPLV